MVAVEGFDILGNVKSIGYSIDALSRTETWTSSVPRLCDALPALELDQEAPRVIAPNALKRYINDDYSRDGQLVGRRGIVFVSIFLFGATA